MTIKKKLTIGISLLTLITTLIACISLGWLATQASTKTLHTEASKHLIAARETSRNRIERYFEQINSQALSFANDRMIIQAMSGFKSATAILNNSYSATQIQKMRTQLQQYYSQEFAQEYRKQNIDKTMDVVSLLNKLSDSAVTLQYLYIQKNSNPLGNKHKLNDAKDGSLYSTTHTTYHPHIKDFLEKFGYYDIFLVDPESGQIIYSVYKELDYATNLKSGAYTNTGLGRAFKKANLLKSRESVLDDFSSYPPSYEAPASFIATPIFEHGQKTGILIFQMPIAEINKIMTNNQQWQSTGMGASGETYIVGSDFKARSISRFLLEDKSNYIATLESSGTSIETINNISAKNTNIGFQTIQTEGVALALSGKKGVASFPDYRGVPVLSAYSPLNIKGLKWSILAEIDQSEAFEPAKALKKNIIITALLVIVLMSILAIIVAFMFSTLISKSIKQFGNTIEDIVKDGQINLTTRLDESSKDEFADLAAHINHLLSKKQETVQLVLRVSEQLAVASEKVSTVSLQTKQIIEDQNQKTEEIATAMNEMTATVQEVAINASNTAEKAQEGHSEATLGNQIAGTTIDSIKQLTTTIESAEQTVQALEQDSQAIGTVLDVIQNIAEQTNLLLDVPVFKLFTY